MSTRLLTFAIVAATLLPASSALARIGGHAGATGRPDGGVCAQCHGGQTYPGARIQVAQDPNQRIRERQCFSRDDEGRLFLANTLFTVPYGASNQRIDLVLDEPPKGTPPTEDGPGTAGLYCPEDTTCGAPYAGFAIEVLGLNAPPGSPPVLKPAGNQADMKQAEFDGKPSRTEVNHSAPRAFAGGKVSWPLVLDLPARGPGAPTSVTLYASANACNANGQADGGDITSVASPLTLYFEYGADTGMHTGPVCNEDLTCETIGGTLGEDGYCSCGEGVELDEDGRCPQGCSHVAVRTGPAGSAVFALVLLGFALLRRRR